MIVVTAPTGNIGRHVVRHLLEAGQPLRLVLRDPARLPETVRARVEVVQGSHGDPAIVSRALAGAQALFWLVPPDVHRTVEQAFLDFTRPAAEAVRAHRVPRVVSITALGRSTRWEHRAGLVTASLRMDDMLMQAGAAFRGLAMPSFMDNLARQAASIAAEGAFSGPIDPHRKAPTTATADMGARAAQLLADPAWTGQHEAPLLGPEDLSPEDMAQTLSAVLGRPIRYRQVTLEALHARCLAQGMTASFAQGYVDMFRAKNEGMDNEAPRTPATASPTTFRTWCETVLAPALAA